MLGYLLAYFLGSGSRSGPLSVTGVLGTIGNEKMRVKERAHIRKSLKQYGGFWYNLDSDTWNQEEWVWVWGPHDAPEELRDGEFLWGSLISIDPSYSRLGV